MRRLTVCADDFAMSGEVSRTIVGLAKAGKINGISAMAVLERWEQDARLLADLPASVGVGLHLVLTDETPATLMPRLAPEGMLPAAGRLERLAWSRRLPLKEIANEIDAQFARFEEVIGRPPAFVDGHQHVHLLPKVRDLVIAATALRAPSAWLRSCEDKLARILSRPFALKSTLNALQSKGFARLAARAGLRCNDSFAGLYDFKADYEELFPRFLASPGQFHLVICHPGLSTDSAPDPIADARSREAEALKSLPVGKLASARGFAFNV